MIFDIRIIFTIQKNGRRQNDKKTNKDRIIKKTEGQNNKKDRRTERKKTKGDLFCLYGIVTTEYRKYF